MSTLVINKGKALYGDRPDDSAPEQLTGTRPTAISGYYTCAGAVFSDGSVRGGFHDEVVKEVNHKRGQLEQYFVGDEGRENPNETSHSIRPRSRRNDTTIHNALSMTRFASLLHLLAHTM
ncbi:hypothetical protein BFP72_12545 [Reichenbachiella sp. 5M10]|nr:hypothetical protein [Reichenbachiella sp. 5M10]PIB36165.1 hypothetical protein BFP72_12545 [Reichenbachiella sp. 5M10]